jgi:hypothetical protein
MENNWLEKAEELLKESITDSEGHICRNYNKSDVLDAMLEAMNLVFEATKKKCSEEVSLDYNSGSCRECGDNLVDKESILNIEKPNL